MNEHEKARQRELQALAVRTAIEYRDVVAPELLDTITGPDEQSIRAAAERAKAASQRIVQRVMQEQARPTVGPDWHQANGEGYGDQQVPDLSSLSMDDYGKLRAQLGIGEHNGGGIFGPAGR